VVLREPNLGGVIGQANHASWVASAAGALSAIVKFLIQGELLPALTVSGNTVAMLLRMNKEDANMLLAIYYT